MAKKYSIECAQPYGDAKADHSAFANSLRSLILTANGRGQDISIVQLVDDRTYPDKAFDFDCYADWLRSNGFEPDLVARESQIVEACDKLLDEIDYSKLTPEVATTLQSKDKYTSQLFIAAWCLARLGYVQIEQFSPDLQAEKLVNILPLTFKSGEDESLDIIRATPYREAVDKIEYIFIPEQ